jgi:hypothetical protein
LFLAPLALHTVGGWALAAVLAAAPVLCLGQAADSIDELAAKATDPTAQLMSLQLSDWYTASFHGLDDTSNQLVFRAALPFDLGATKHIFRVTQPYSMSSPAGGGLIDITVFDLVVFDRPWGRWGAGVSGTMPTGSSGLTTDKWTAGPALGFVNSSTRPVNWGLFMQSFFSFAGKSGAPDVGIINLQPIFSYQLGGGRSLSLGNSALLYDTEKSRWASLLASLNYGQVVSFGGHKWRPNFEIGYDLKNDLGNPKWVIRVGIVLLLPT